MRRCWSGRDKRCGRRRGRGHHDDGGRRRSDVGRRRCRGDGSRIRRRRIVVCRARVHLEGGEGGVCVHHDIHVFPRGVSGEIVTAVVAVDDDVDLEVNCLTRFGNGKVLLIHYYIHLRTSYTASYLLYTTLDVIIVIAVIVGITIAAYRRLVAARPAKLPVQ